MPPSIRWRRPGSSRSSSKGRSRGSESPSSKGDLTRRVTGRIEDRVAGRVERVGSSGSGRSGSGSSGSGSSGSRSRHEASGTAERVQKPALIARQIAHYSDGSVAQVAGSLRLISPRRLYDHGVQMLESPALAGLMEPLVAKVNPAELEVEKDRVRLGCAPRKRRLERLGRSVARPRCGRGPWTCPPEWSR